MMTDKLKPCRHSEATKEKLRAAALKRVKPNHMTHGFSCKYPKLYSMWGTMKSRCENPNRPKYKDYGARGIKVCTEWHDAEKFCKWALENGYAEGLQLDRIDVDGDYCPSNCRWVTPKENSRNRRNNQCLTVNGVTKCVAEWCEEISISPNTIYWWIRTKGRSYAEQRIEKYIAA